MSLSLLAALAMSQSQTYTNPVYDANFPDPFIVEHEGTFYAYATQRGPGGFQLMTSKDLINWKQEKPPFKPSWSDRQYWAPEVYQYRGKWYFFYSALNPKTNKRDLAVAVGDGPKGPFKELNTLIYGTSENQGTSDDGAIDPALHFEDGKVYMCYIREAHPRALKMVELAPDLLSTIGDRHTLLVIDRPEEQGILDAPTLIKQNGKYWLFYSSGWFQSNKNDANYRVRTAVSDSILGPYKKTYKSMVESVEGKTYSPGHQTIFQLKSGEWWMAYHGWNAEGDPRYGSNPKGRTLRIDRLHWTEDGPTMEGATTDPRPVPKID